MSEDVFGCPRGRLRILPKTMYAVILSGMMMKTFVLALLSLGIAFAGEKNYKVEYVGGSLPLKTGSGMKLYVSPDAVELRKGGDIVATIPAAGLTVEYGMDFKPITAGQFGANMVTLGMSSVWNMGRNQNLVRHVSLTWTVDGKPRNILVNAGTNVAALLADMQAATGKPAR